MGACIWSDGTIIDSKALNEIQMTSINFLPTILNSSSSHTKPRKPYLKIDRHSIPYPTCLDKFSIAKTGCSIPEKKLTQLNSRNGC